MPARPRTLIPLLGVVFALAGVLPARAQHPNVRVSSPSSSTPEEVAITVDPSNPQRLAAAANLRYRYHSFDGGASWTEGLMSTSLGAAGDPVVLYDRHGNLFNVHLSNPTVGGSWLDRIVVQRSTDGGLTWNGGAGIGLDAPRDQDKPWIAVDETGSPYADRLYLSWTEFDAYGSFSTLDSTRILFSSSADFGLGWIPPVRVNDASGDCVDEDGTVEGAVPAVGPNGEVYVAWSGPAGIRFDRSLDGGSTWGADVFVNGQPGGWDFAVPGVYRCNGLPTTLCDISNSPHRGTLYVVWSDQRMGPDDTDVFVARSADGGLSWSAPVRVNGDPPGRHQFFPAAALDPATGVLYVAYYDRGATIGDATEVSLARSGDGGHTFLHVPISDSPFTPRDDVFFGDYIGITARSGRVHAAWMRMDSGLLSVWTAGVNDTTLVAAVPAAPRPVAVSLRAAYPNPARSSTRLGYALAGDARVILRIVDIQGREVAVLVNERQAAGEHLVTWDARNVPPGVYLCALSAAGESRTTRLVVVR
jgi:hypothetical protein